MRSIRPKVTGCDQVTIAESQHQYLEITGARTHHPEGDGILLAFQPNLDDLRLLVAGEAIYINLLTFGGAMQPIIVLTGRHQAAAAFGLGVEE